MLSSVVKGSASVSLRMQDIKRPFVLVEKRQLPTRNRNLTRITTAAFFLKRDVT